MSSEENSDTNPGSVSGFAGGRVNADSDYTDRLSSMAASYRPNSVSPGGGLGGLTRGALGGGTQNARTQLYDALKYPTEGQLSFQRYLGRYKRQDIARGLIDRPIDDTWQELPRINDREGDPSAEDPETDFETDVRDFFDNSSRMGPLPEGAPDDSEYGMGLRASPYQRIVAADTLATIGQFSLLVFGFSDGSSMDEPLEPGSLSDQGLRGLSYIEIFDETQVDIVQEGDLNSERYGRVREYTIEPNDIESTRGGGTSGQQRVHHSRCIHIAQGTTNDPYHGDPFLRDVINRLIDCDKILGGSGEGYWRGGYQGFVLRPPEDALGRTVQFEDSSALAQEIQEYTNNYQRTIATTGRVETLGSDISSPQPHMEAQYEAIAAAKQYPVSILRGNETGERATTQDSKMWAQTIQSRRNQYAEPEILRPIISLLIRAGVLSEPETGSDDYLIHWPTLDEPSATDKANIMSSKATAMASATGGMVEKAFTIPEIRREVFDMKPERGSEAPSSQGAGAAGIDRIDTGDGPDPAEGIDQADAQVQAQFERESQGADTTNTGGGTTADQSNDAVRFSR